MYKPKWDHDDLFQLLLNVSFSCPTNLTRGKEWLDERRTSLDFALQIPHPDPRILRAPRNKLAGAPINRHAGNLILGLNLLDQSGRPIRLKEVDILARRDAERRAALAQAQRIHLARSQRPVQREGADG